MPETIGYLIGTNPALSGISAEGGWERENFGNLFAFDQILSRGLR
jgi:hypothetical protein